MKDYQLDKLAVKELLALKAEVEAAIIDRKETDRAEVKEKLKALAEKSGYDIDEIFGKGRRNGAGKSTGKVAPKYRNPQNPSDTWTGRGRMPLWMKALTDKGAKREKFLIK